MRSRWLTPIRSAPAASARSTSALRRGPRPARPGPARRPAGRRPGQLGVVEGGDDEQDGVGAHQPGVAHVGSSTVKSLRSTGRPTAPRAAARSSGEPPKWAPSVSTDRQAAPPASYCRGHVPRDPGPAARSPFDGERRLTSAMTATPVGAGQCAPERPGRPASAWPRRASVVRGAAVGGGPLPVGGHDAVEVGHGLGAARISYGPTSATVAARRAARRPTDVGEGDRRVAVARRHGRGDLRPRPCRRRPPRPRRRRTPSADEPAQVAGDVAAPAVDAGHQLLAGEAALGEAHRALDDAGLGRDRALGQLGAHRRARRPRCAGARRTSAGSTATTPVGQPVGAEQVDARRPRPGRVERRAPRRPVDRRRCPATATHGRSRARGRPWCAA